MLKKLQNLFGDQEDNSIIPGTLTQQNQNSDLVNSSIELADSLWQKGEIQQAINLYQDEIQKNPHTEEIQVKLAKLLQQQQNISESYQKLAAAFKKQGNPDQAAEYYRQAIVIKSLVRSNAQKNAQLATSSCNDLSDSAFSFIPSLKSSINLANPKTKKAPTKVLSNDNSDNPSFSSQAEEVPGAGDSNIAWETIQLYAEQALNGYDNAQWQKTVDACQKILEICPEMAEAYKILGNALQRMGNTKKAMDCYAKALKIQPDLAIVYAGIGKLYYQQQKWLKAKEYYQKATIINPRYPEAYLNLANIWEQLDEPMKAKSCRTRAASLEGELNPHSSLAAPDNLLPKSIETTQAIETYYNLAQNLEQNQKWQEAAFHYRKAVELNNIYLDSHGNNQLSDDLDLATGHHISQSQLEKGIRYYQNQAQLKPSSANIQLNLGNLYVKNQQWQKAIASYKQAIKIEPTCAQAYLNLGKALAAIGQQAESLEQLYLGYTIKPELGDADSLFNLGEALVKQGDRRRAIHCYSFATHLKPDFVAAYHKLAETLIQLGRKQEAIDCYRKAISNNPQDTDSHFLLGEQLTANRQWDSAVAAYRRVLELQPKYPQASYKLSHVLSEKIKSELIDRYRY